MSVDFKDILRRIIDLDHGLLSQAMEHEHPTTEDSWEGVLSEWYDPPTDEDLRISLPELY